MIRVKVKCREVITCYKDNNGKVWRIGDTFNGEVIKRFLFFGSPEFEEWLIKEMNWDAKAHRKSLYRARERSIGKPIVLYEKSTWDFLNNEDDGQEYP